MSSVSAGPWFLRHAGLFVIQATPRAPHTLAEVEAVMPSEAEERGSVPVSEVLR